MVMCTAGDDIKNDRYDEGQQQLTPSHPTQPDPRVLLEVGFIWLISDVIGTRTQRL
jgi:hypothetical protein